MNPFLFEPYSAYAPKGRKKHWMEIAEEEALMHRIMQEQMMRESKTAQMTVQDSVQNGPSCATVGSPAAGGAGGGGVPDYSFFQNTEEIANFSFTDGLAGPATITFTNLTPTPNDDVFYWDLGTGSLTSTEINPVQLYTMTGSFTVALQSTAGGQSGVVTSVTKSLTIISPVVTAAFTMTTSSNVGPSSASFTNASTNTSQTPTTTYRWLFGDGITSSLASPAHTYTTTGSFTASLQVTGSYRMTSVASRSFTLASPVITPNFTVTTSSNKTAPLFASFTNTSTNTVNADDSVSYRWVFGNSASAVTTTNATTTYDTGSFIVTLQMSESYFGLRSTKILGGGITSSMPVVTGSFRSLPAARGAAPLNVTFSFLDSSITSSTTPDTYTYLWVFGSGSLTSTSASPTMSYSSASSYTVRLNVTESAYKAAFSITSASVIVAS